MSQPAALHGGPDAWGVPLHDFSTNANACGPCPGALAAIGAADATRYPDPGYLDLRSRIADFHQVAVDRVHLAASASEFIARMSAAVALCIGRQGVAVPQPGYGDYARAAQAHGLPLVNAPQAALSWLCDPTSPTGGDAVAAQLSATPGAVVAIDRAYAPLRLQGAALDMPTAWELWTPNKALGLTGVRGAYAIAPAMGQGGDALADRLNALMPSWPIGAHGVAMLYSWLTPDTQQWVAQSRQQLREWKGLQIRWVQALGWRCLPSVANFFCAQPPSDEHAPVLSERLAHLRAAYGVKLRDTTSMGLPGFVRLNVMPPQSQQALRAALVHWR